MLQNPLVNKNVAMKKLTFLFLFIPILSFGQKPLQKILKFNPEASVIQAEASCGICMFNMKGKECELAVKIEKSRYYYVAGTDIDDYGDAHSETGFCNAIRKADIQGKVNDNKFHVTYFKLTKD